MIVTVNPATGAPLAEYRPSSAADIERTLDAAEDARAIWSGMPVIERAVVLGRLAKVLDARRDELARLITVEMGKPLREARAEVDKCQWAVQYVADTAAGALADEPVVTGPDETWIGYEPLGTVLAVMPWNFPLWQVVRAVVPALAAGNAVVVKHAANTTGCALALAAVFADAGVPDGLYGPVVVLEADAPAVVERLIADDRVDAVTLTGSTRAGAAVAAAAGRAIKPSVLELGGSDPFVVLDDADVEAVVTRAVRARFLNGGQSCISAKRFLVAEAIADEFTDMLAFTVDQLVVGDPTAESTDLGPLARADLVAAVHRQVQASVAAGARLLAGGTAPDGPGFFYRPTLLADVTADMTVCTEETFGPVATVVRVADDAAAVAEANRTPWGLGASVWTADPDRGRAVAAGIRSGAVFVNAVVASDPRLPFGGVGRSGYGRELGVTGLRTFTNVRSWWVAKPPVSEEGSIR